MPGTLFVVATPIGNLEDITLRALRVLREVALIAAEDTRRTAHLLARHAIRTPTTSLHEHNEHHKAAAIVARLERGENVALVSDAGTPTVSDPGGELIRRAVAAGIRIEAIPGPSAVMAAVSAAGFPDDSFTFLGFPPTGAKDRKRWFERLAQVGGLIVFFEAPHRITRTLTEIRDRFGDIDVVVGRELTKLHEQLVRRPISDAIEELSGAKGELTVVANIGYITEKRRATDSAEQLSRRQAMAAVAKAYGLTSNQLYDAIAKAKQLAK